MSEKICLKKGTSLASVGGASPDTLALYRIVGGESGAADERYGYLTGGTKFLPATNGAGWGPFKMVQLAQYSPRAIGLDTITSVAGNWFMGRGGQGHYIHNYSQFQGFSMSFIGWFGALFTGGGAYYTAVDLIAAAKTGAVVRAGGPVTAAGSLIVTVYQASMYRDVYQMYSCPTFGPNYCP